MPSNYGYLNLINNVAGPSSLPPGWHFSQAGTIDVNTGFRANAYYNDSGQVVMAFYGPSTTGSN
jgi:hypothetical protein